MTIEEHLAKVAEGIRQELVAAAEEGTIENRMNLKVEIEGRIIGGSLRMTIGLGSYGNEVEGRTFSALAPEYLRRKGWEKHNAPLELAPPGDEIPF